LDSVKAPEDIAKANFPGLRFFNVEQLFASSPRHDVNASPWTPIEASDAIPELTHYIAAFRQEVQIHRQMLPDQIKALETWIRDARQSMAAGTDLPEEPAWPIYPGAKDNRQPAAIYNAMVYPLIPYAIRGAIWYQGESNTSDSLYDHMMRALIGGWRFRSGRSLPPRQVHGHC